MRRMARERWCRAAFEQVVRQENGFGTGSGVVENTPVPLP
ncbi:hypothetical protein STXM2123_4980 [Streptomyces sp. F-3]|nr:hypothetical protein STXM2123_4980 [Streptomyces sp. F-3]